MLKKLISTAIVVSLVISLLAMGVNAQIITGASSANPNLIYFRDFEDFAGDGERLAASSSATDWVYSYSTSTFYPATVDGSKAIVAGGGGDSNIYRLATPVTSGRFYLSMDIGYTSGADNSYTWSDLNSSKITFYTEAYDPNANGGQYAALDGNGRRNIVGFIGRKHGYIAGYPDGYFNAQCGSPSDGFETYNSKGAQEYLAPNTLHRLDMIYNLDADYMMILLDGNVMLNASVPTGQKETINQITAIGIKPMKGMIYDNIMIQTLSDNSFAYSIKNKTSSGFDIEFNHSVHSFTENNVSVDGTEPVSVTRKNANLYTVTAPMTSDSVVDLIDVVNVMGNKINDSIKPADKQLAYKQLADINFNGASTLDTSSTDASVTYDGVTLRKIDSNTATLRTNANSYKDSTDVLRIGIANYGKAATDEFLFDFSKSGYLIGQLTVAYNAKFSDVAYVEPYIVFDDDTKYMLPWYTSGSYEYNGTTEVIEDGIWYNIKNVFDFDTNTITAYLNGKVFYRGGFKKPETFADKTNIKGFCLGVTNKANTWSVFYIDDLDVHTECETNDIGIYISGAKKTGTVDTGNTVTYTAKVFNTTSLPINPYLLTGIYNDNILIEANYKQIGQIPSGGFKDASFAVICNADTTMVKGFIWDSLTNITPLCSVFTLGKALNIVSSGAFDDVDESHQYSKTINLLNMMNVTEGNGNGKFYPDQYITNGEFADMTVAAFSIGGESKHSFKDIPASEDYADAVAKATSAGIIMDGFDPTANITQQEAVAILVNAYEKAGNVVIPTTDAVESFSDGNMVSDWAVTSMDKAATYRFVPVGSETALRPTVGVTRGEAAQLIGNALLTLEERRTDDYTSSTSFIQTEYGNIFLRSEKADIGVKTGASIFGWEVRGYYGDIIKKGYEKTQNGEAMLNFDDLDLGHYSLKVFAMDESGVRHDMAETFFAIIDDYDFMSVPYDESPFGMNTSYYLYYLGWSPEYTHEMIYNSGARNIRDGCSWRAFETSAGNYVLYQPETIEMFKQYGMTQLYSAGYSHPSYDDGNPPYTTEGIQAFANYVKALYDLHDGYVQYVDVHNEWWAEKFGGGPANCSPVIYAELAKKTWEAVKPDYPDSKLGLVVGNSSTYRDWTEELFAAGALESADYLQYHTYTKNPETDIKADVEFFNEMVEKYGNGKAVGIWLTETGTDNALQDTTGVTMREAANLIPRQHIVSFANGIEKVYDYSLMNRGANPANNEDNFGLVYNLSSVYGPLVPKESYVSYAVMTRQLTGLDFKETKRADNIQHYVFEGNGRKVETLYSLEDTSVTLLTSTPVKATDIMGIENTYYPLDGKIYLDLCTEMLYLEGDFEVSDMAIPVTRSVTNAVAGADTQFNFVTSGELAGKSLTGRVYKDTFNVANGYSFKAPTEVCERIYILDLETSEKPFARLRQIVEFTN